MAYGKMAPKDSKGSKPMSADKKSLAAKYGDKNKITRGDIITAATEKKGGNMASDTKKKMAMKSVKSASSKAKMK